MGGIFGQVTDLTAVFTPWLLLAIFLMGLIAEFGVSIPYLMETVWLFSGYNLVVGNITIEHILLFLVVALIGRILGSSILFYISWYGKASLGLLFVGYVKPRMTRIAGRIRPVRKIFNMFGSVARRITLRNSKSALTGTGDSTVLTLFGKKLSLSPITVAIGRFMWLRLPITIALGAKKRRTSLILGVAIFSLVWDGAYIIFGVLGGKGGLEPVQMFFYPLAAMIMFSVLAFGFRRLRRVVVSE